MTYSLLHEITQVFLLCIGLYVVVRGARDIFSSNLRGTIVGIEGLSPNCGAGSAAAVIVHVRLGDGTIAKAEMSPCTACLERIKTGDMVALTRSGMRLIAQRGVAWWR